VGPIYGSHPIGLLYFIGPLDLEPSSKVALRNNDHVYYRVVVHNGGKAKVGGKLQNYLTRWITKP